MAQPVNTAAGGDLKAKPRTSSRVSSALKSGVVYGGSAVLTAVNNITPHIAGAVDILVIEQPDGSRKATPFYVRFGKYTALRTRERNVKLYINDELAPFGMHIGMYGQAYFATETVEVREGDDDEQEALLAGMMSPPSGYSSGADEAATHADGSEAGATLSAVRQRIDGMKAARRASSRSAAGTGGSSQGPRVPLPALGAGASAFSPGMAESVPTAPASGERSVGVLPGQVQLAPSLSMADRNESFLSARETLATPLGDELVAGALAPLSPALPASPERRMRASRSESQLQVAEQLLGQAQGARASSCSSVPRPLPPHGGSTNSLQTVSEGASPCGWSEDGEAEEEDEEPSGEGERGGGERGGAEEGAPGARPPGAGGAAREAEVAEQQQQPGAAAPAPQPPQQHLQQGHVQTQLQHHSGLQQPLHQQLGFPENDQVAGGAAAAGTVAVPPLPQQPCTGLDTGCPASLEPQQAGRPKLHATVDWAQVLCPPAGTGSGHAPGSVPLPPLAGQVPAGGGADASAAMRHGPCRTSFRASPGAGPTGLAASLGQDCHGPSSGPGSYSAVSLLSSSLRGGGSGVSLVGLDGRIGAVGGGRTSLEWLRAAGQAGAAEPQAPSAFLQPQAVAAAAAAAAGGQPLAGTAADNGSLGPIAAAAAAATRSAPAEAPLSLAASQSELESSSSGVSLYLTVTEEGDVRVRLTAMQLPLASQQPPSGAQRQSGEEATGGAAAAAAAAAGPVSRKDTPAGSENGYLGDVERAARAAAATAAATAATPVPQHHHVSHHYHYTHAQGHGHSRHDHHHDLLHSASAPLPSSAIDAAAAAAAADAAASGGATTATRPATAAHGIELSLCGSHLTASMSYAEATVLFHAHRVSEDLFFSRAELLAGGSELAIRLSNGVIFLCQPLSYSLLGLLAFGTWRLPPGTPCWAPDGADSTGASEAAATSAAAAAAAAMLAAAVAQGAGVAAAAAAAAPTNGTAGAASSAATTPKKGQAAAGTGTGSWRLWMFGTRREGARGSGTGGSTSGVAASIGGRSPPLTSPIAERQGSIEHRTAGTGAGAEAAPPPALPPASAALPPALPSASQAEGGGGAAAADVAVAAAGGGNAAAAAAGGTSRDDSGRSEGFNVVTKKSLTPSVEQLAALPLKHGQNTVMYKVGGSELRAYVYFLPWRTRIVISDIDGTITKSDVLGHLLPAMGLDWSHPGIAQLLTNIRQNNYLIMYLSSRSISQANITRDFINTLVQGEHRMPLGPVIISPHGLLPSLYREMILRRPHEFKIATLQDIRALFPPDWNPFYGGFGNRDTDEISYREVGVPPARIFIINPRGELRQPIDSVPRESAAAAADVKAQSPEDAASDGGNSSGGADPSSDAAAPPQAVLSPTASSAAPASSGIRESSSRSVSPAPAAAAGAAALPGREASSRSVGAAGSVGRRASGSAAATAAAGTVALSTLSAINEFVHDIFPPLRDGERMPSSEDEDGRGDRSEAAGGSGDEGTHEGEARGSAARQRRSGSVESGEGGAGEGADLRPGGEGGSSGAVVCIARREAGNSPGVHCPSGPPTAAVTPRSAASPRGSRAPSSVASEPDSAPAVAAAPAVPSGAFSAAVDTEDGAPARSASPASCLAGEQPGGVVVGKSGVERGIGESGCAGQPAARGGACSGGDGGGGSPSGLPGPNVVDEVVATAVPLPA